MAAPGSWVQEMEGIEDSPEKYIEDLKKAGGDDDLIKVLAENATPAAEWMRDFIGIEFLDSLMFFGGHSVARAVIPLGHSGVEIIEKYSAKANEVGVEVLTEHDVKEILVEDGKVVGVKAETPYGELIVHAKALFTQEAWSRPEMLLNMIEIDDKILSTNSPGATGDGILMAELLVLIQQMWTRFNFINL